MHPLISIGRATAAALLLFVLGGPTSPVAAQSLPPFEMNSEEAAIVDSSGQVLQDIMSNPATGIPASLLQNAEGLVIVPGMLKGGFVLGAKHGRGVVLVRDPNAGWQLPQFITVTGGSVGWQAGIQAIDLVLVFKTKKSVQGLLTGKFTLGADAAVAAGPVGREASAATDAKLQAEIYSYSRTRGLFAGVSLDGSKLSMDRNATDVYYRPVVPLSAGQAAPLPASALRLLQVVNHYAPPPAAAAPIVELNPVAAPQPALDVQTVRQNLAAASQRLAPLLDDNWKNYLALPNEVYGGDQPPSPEALAVAVARYQAVASHPQYAALAARPEFIETSQALGQYSALLPRPTLNLPPPPQP